MSSPEPHVSGRAPFESVERLRAMADHVPALMAYIDPEQRYQYANEAFRTWFGLDPAAMIGRTIEEVLGEAVAARAQPRIARVLAGETVHFQTWVAARTGILSVDATYSPDVGADGKVGGFYLTVIDATERERAGRALQELTTLQVAILDSANLAIVTTDVHGVIWTFNSTAERWLGYRVEEVIGRTKLAHFLDPDEVAARERELEPRSGRPFSSLLDWLLSAIEGTGRMHDEREWTFVRKDGTRFPVSLTLNVLRDSAGEPTGAVGVARDITAEKAAEVAQERAREAAELASRTKSQFLAHMSHEVRNPLHGIIGVTSILLETSLDEVQRPLAETAHSGAQDLLGIVGRVLDFSKIEAGKLELETRDFSPAAVVREVARLHAVRAAAKGVAIQWNAAPEVPEFVSGDGDRLRQILHNLVGNAVKFSSRGVVQAAIRETAEIENARSLPPGQIGLRFSVHDEGIGIPPDAQARIFEPFAQADESMARRFGGTGLGLAIARQLVELMGGEIGVESKPDAGAMFWFTAVFGAALGEEKAGVVSAEPLGQTGGPSHPLRVLLVDDSDVNRLIARHQLERMGCALAVAECGRSAVEAAAAQRFDLILMDCQMPEMDGFAATAEIRQREGETGRRARIVALTAMAPEGEREHCLAAGMDEYLAKPFQASQLAAIVRAAAVSAGRASSPAGVLEPSALENLRDSPSVGGESLFARLVQIYEREAPESLRTMKLALERGDTDALEIAAHKLKGASANFGATQLRHLCQLAEDLCREGQVRFVRWLLPEIEKELEAVIAALREAL